MCGIAGIYSLKNENRKWFDSLQSVTDSLKKRGPDAGNIWQNNNVALAHRRLSIIDVSENANQPLWDESKNYCIIFNGEIFNYRELKTELVKQGVSFLTQSDTEVVLQLFIREGEKFLNRLNGFYALAIYDSINNKMLVARDRYGVKPLYYFFDESVFVFASEMKGMVNFPVNREIDLVSLSLYFRLNYIPQPRSIFKNIKQLNPGSYFFLDGKSPVEEKKFYSIPFVSSKKIHAHDYEESKKKLVELTDDAVKRRLISDVPLGAFLSGGIDSSVVVAMAARHTDHLKTFSIGFRDEPFFDETQYAELVARKFKTEHTVFSLTTDDLLHDLFDVLDYIDEPFADSSAIPVHILSRHTREKVTVALSGDGADELFGGYMKHVGEYKIRNAGTVEKIISSFDFLLRAMPQSRNGKISNTIRRMNKLSQGMKMNVKDRYWKFCTIGGDEYVNNLLQDKWKTNSNELQIEKEFFLKPLNTSDDMNEVLLADMTLVLPSDMLTKVDRMSMANSLEVRTPFLDYRMVDFAFSLPAGYKINGNSRKRIVQDAFREILPKELYNRPKQGFEVPLLNWFRTKLKNTIDELTSKEFIESQSVFNYNSILKLKEKLHSNNPGDSAAQIWAIIVFQYWWKRFMID
ncbi:MAG TPA: asparagine synthase (glutamine-hydrolyzing) [Bacteroidetes bacterium]|nr:asparagine synthase (glutamine-hydrolyzing) [Bacteroidota bacterium]